MLFFLEQRSINQRLNQIHTSRIRETPNERKTSKVLPPIVHASQDLNQSCIEPIDSPVLITLPFKDQKSADSVRKQLNDLGKKIDRVIQPVFTSKKISEDLKVTETKPSLVNQQCVVYEFQCNSCDSNYIGYTSRHLHLRIEEHKYSVIGKHLQDKHNQRPTNLHEQFTILKKCHGKFECLIYEMLLYCMTKLAPFCGQIYQ